MVRTLPRLLAIPWPDAASRWIPFSILAGMSVTTLLWLGRDLSFLQDDCDFIRHPFTFATILGPHNEHWHTLPLILWRSVQWTFGVGSYLPFLAVLALVNVVVAAGIFALWGGFPGLAAAALLLFLGTGADNLLWAFQTGFVGSTAFGIWAFVALQSGRHAVAAGLLVGSVASSAMGVPFLVAALLYRPSWWMALPMTVLSAWFLTYGRTGVSTHTDPLEHFDRLPRLFVTHPVDALAALTGLGPLAAILLVAAVAVAVIRGWRPSRILMAALVGIAVEIAMVGLVRDSGWSNRYQTTFVVLGMVGLTGMTLRRGAWVLFGLWALIFVVNVQALVSRPGQLAAFAAQGYACDPTSNELPDGEASFRRGRDAALSQAPLSRASTP